MSSSQASTGSLLRRPLRPQHSGLSSIASHRSSETHLSNRLKMLPGMRPMPSIISQDGMQSPVPTMQSEYDPVAQPKRVKQRKGYSSHNDSENVTTNGDTSESLSKKGLVLPYKPRGPDPFPMREPKRPADVKRENILPSDCMKEIPEFALEDFMLKNRPYGVLRKSSLKQAVLSRANYKKLTILLQRELMQYQTSVGTVDVSEQAELKTAPHARVPKSQLILEMKQVVQERLKELGATSPGKFNESSAEVNRLFEEIQDFGDSEGLGRKTQISLFNKATSAVFQTYRGKTGSSFDGENTESIITPSELSILNCLMDGGYVLSLKAHFIPRIPELSPLSTTLVYLNLSFNELVNFPRDVLACRELQVLKLRNNPLKDIPHDISKLKKLRTLILSFCCLTALPVSLFSLTKLEFFDVSYNKLTFLANEIKKLEKLRFLNVEGNELAGLPCGLLRLNLFRIRVRNNFMNPLFWKENSTNDPQRLTDLCLVVLKSKVSRDDPRKMEKYSAKVVRAMNDFLPCDCCDGPRYGPGLRIIRPCTEIWGIKRLPFIFQSCSPKCYSAFIHNIDPKISELLYGTIVDTPNSPVVQEPVDDDSLGEAPSLREGAITA